MIITTTTTPRGASSTSTSSTSSATTPSPSRPRCASPSRWSVSLSISACLSLSRPSSIPPLLARSSSLFLSRYLHCLLVCPSFCLSVCPSLSLSIPPSVCLYLSLSFCPFAPPMRLSEQMVCLPVRRSKAHLGNPPRIFGRVFLHFPGVGGRRSFFHGGGGGGGVDGGGGALDRAGRRRRVVPRASTRPCAARKSRADHDMAGPPPRARQVMAMGGRHSRSYVEFQKYCCKAYLILRKAPYYNHRVFLLLLLRLLFG